MFARNTIVYAILATLLSTVTASSHLGSNIAHRHHNLNVNRAFTPVVSPRAFHKRCQQRFTAPATSSSTPAPAPTTSTTSEKAPDPTTSSSEDAPAPAATTKASSDSGNSGAGSGSSGVGFYDGTNSGQMTFYSTGLGACGITNNDGDFIAAASHTLFDAYPGSNGNPNQSPLCNKNVVISYQGKEITIAITDRCEGCAPTDLDLSPTAFSALADQSVGRTGMTWRWA